MIEQDPAALIAEVRFYSAKARRVMEEINADPPQYVDYLDRLAAALERAQADAARMRGFGIPRSARSLAIAACDALGLSHADDFDAVEQAIEMELDVHNISAGDVPIVIVARAAIAALVQGQTQGGERDAPP